MDDICPAQVVYHPIHTGCCRLDPIALAGGLGGQTPANLRAGPAFGHPRADAAYQRPVSRSMTENIEKPRSDQAPVMAANCRQAMDSGKAPPMNLTWSVFAIMAANAGKSSCVGGRRTNLCVVRVGPIATIKPAKAQSLCRQPTNRSRPPLTLPTCLFQHRPSGTQ
ncbi:MAG: hypothetical protein RL230_2981 [Pseudomonadota bacterium]